MQILAKHYDATAPLDNFQVLTPGRGIDHDSQNLTFAVAGCNQQTGWRALRFLGEAAVHRKPGTC